MEENYFDVGRRLSSERHCCGRRSRTTAAWLLVLVSYECDTFSSAAFSYQGAAKESLGRKRFLRDNNYPKNNMNWNRINRSKRWYIESEPCFLVNSPISPDLDRRMDDIIEKNEIDSTRPSRYEDSFLVTKESESNFFIKSPSSQQLLADFLDRALPQPQNKKASERGISNDSNQSAITSKPEQKLILKSKSTRKNGKMPPWLWTFSTKSSNSSPIKKLLIPDIPIPTTIELQLSLNTLKENMSSRSHMSEQEIDTVIKSMKLAVRTCNSPSAVTLSGVIQFVSILVECMEFGPDAIIAGVFHYCSCIKVREQDILTSEPQDRSYIDFESRYLQTLAGVGLEQFGRTAVQIALDAARLKGTEMMASSILKSDKTNGVLQILDGKNLKSLLLTVNAGLDWRALGLRCAACLYRLRGLGSLRTLTFTSRLVDKKSPTIMLDEISVAREALYIYAPLAHQMGTYRLKCELEGAAFQVLYRRQYGALSALLRRRHDSNNVQHRRGIPLLPSPFFFADFKGHRTDFDSIDVGMKSIMDDLSNRIKRLLQEDETMMEHVADMKVTARIKEPYSLWRKMLEIHKRNIAKFNKHPGQTRPALSILQVPDAVALRIILKVRKLTKDEDDKETTEREHSLCYYVQDLCMKNLPSSNTHTRMKDYIQSPKTNGYQSLHYSSKMRWHGEEYPYEVQIRSAEMHRVAEYGVASHWSYKESSFRYRTESRASSSVSDTYLRSIQNSRPTKNQEDPQLSWSSKPMLIDDDFSKCSDDGYLSLVFDPASYRRNQRDDDPINKLNQALRIERLRARAESIAPYIEALSTARMDLAREQVFVFCNHPVYNEDSSSDEYSSTIGSIITLPAGALVIDAIREEERLSGFSFSNRSLLSGSRRIDNESIVLRNGVLTTLTQPLENGDVVTVCRPSARADGCEVY